MNWDLREKKQEIGFINMEVGVDSNVNACDVMSDVTLTVYDVSLRHLVVFHVGMVIWWLVVNR